MKGSLLVIGISALALYQMGVFKPTPQLPFASDISNLKFVTTGKLSFDLTLLNPNDSPLTFKNITGNLTYGDNLLGTFRYSNNLIVNKSAKIKNISIFISEREYNGLLADRKKGLSLGENNKLHINGDVSTGKISDTVSQFFFPTNIKG